MWNDITDVARLCVENMQRTQESIMAIPSFNLADSMSCVEITDTKTDPYCMSVYRPIEILISDGFLSSTFSDINCLFLIKKMFLAELTWYNGGSLPESLLYSAFCHKKVLDSLKLQGNIFLSFLREISVITLKTCHYAMKFIVTSDVYEDNDFSPCNLFYLAEDIDDYEISASLNSKLQDLSTITESTLFLQFQLIVQFRLSMLQVMKSLFLSIRQGTTDIEAIDQPSNITADIASCLAHLDDLLLSDWGRVATPPLDAYEDRLFNQYIAKMATPSPTRKLMQIIDCTEVVCQFKKMFEESFLALTLVNDILGSVPTAAVVSNCTNLAKKYFYDSFPCLCCVILSDNSSKRTLDFLLQVAHAISKSGFNILSRSLFSSLFLKTAPSIRDNSLARLIINSLEKDGIPSDIISIRSVVVNVASASSELNIGSLDLFATNLMTPLMADTVRVLMHSRCRLAVMFENLFDKWTMVERHAISLDESLYSKFIDSAESSMLSTKKSKKNSKLRNKISEDKADVGVHYEKAGVLRYLSRYASLLAIEAIEAFLESDLISDCEMDGFYCYYEYLLTVSIYTHRSLKEGEEQLKKSALDLVRLPLDRPARPALASISEVWLGTKQSYCRYAFRIFLLLEAGGFIDKSCHSISDLPLPSLSQAPVTSVALSDIIPSEVRTSRLSSWRWRYIERFRTFLRLGRPPYMEYGDYITSIKTCTGQETINPDQYDLFQLLESAASWLGSAKQYLDKLNEMSAGFDASAESCLKSTCYDEMNFGSVEYSWDWSHPSKSDRKRMLRLIIGGNVFIRRLITSISSFDRLQSDYIEIQSQIKFKGQLLPAKSKKEKNKGVADIEEDFRRLMSVKTDLIGAVRASLSTAEMKIVVKKDLMTSVSFS